MTWLPGTSIVIRDVRAGRIRAVVASVVVEDRPERLITWTPNGSPLLLPADESGTLTKEDDFNHLEPLSWQAFGGPLYIWPRGELFSLRVSWSDSTRTHLDHWYVNLHTPVQRTAIGLDTTDQLLDVIIEPDLAHWHWKDELEFEGAVASGRFSNAEAASIRATGRGVVEMARRREPPFNEVWAHWRPDPSWRIPELPEDWERTP